MAIKNIDKEKLQSFVGKEYTVTEMLDGIPFRLAVTNKGVFMFKGFTKSRVTQVDYLCNSVWHEIKEFTDKVLSSARDVIVGEYCECFLDFMYFPTDKPRNVEYPGFAGKFVLLDNYAHNPKYKAREFKYDWLRNLCEPAPVISSAELTKLDLDVINKIEDPVELATIFIGSDSTYSCIPLSNIEGVIVDFGSSKFKININDTNAKANVFEKKIYRDSILTDFANVELDSSVGERIHHSKSYIENICDVFVDYMSKTDFFKKNDIEVGDLKSPVVGYTGDMTVSDIPNYTAQTICKYDENARDLLKILLFTFQKPKINTKVNDFSPIVLAKFAKFYQLLKIQK